MTFSTFLSGRNKYNSIVVYIERKKFGKYVNFLIFLVTVYFYSKIYYKYQSRNLWNFKKMLILDYEHRLNSSRNNSGFEIKNIKPWRFWKEEMSSYRS